MLVSVIITCYNYKNYVRECVESVLNQTYKNYEIIFVDDGSRDGSLEVVSAIKSDSLKIISKENGGQLSAFNAGFLQSRGVVVAFLDADDLYEPDYLEKLLTFYSEHADADYVFTSISRFGSGQNENVIQNTRCFGYSVCSANFLRNYIGAETSAISMRRRVLEKILPLELESDWRVRADDCLTWGASLVGAKKYAFGDAVVKYRVHTSNGFYGKNFDLDYIFKRELNISKLFKIIKQKNDIFITISLLQKEFQSIPAKRINDLISYLKIVLIMKVSFFHKINTFIKLLIMFMFKRRFI